MHLQSPSSCFLFVGRVHHSLNGDCQTSGPHEFSSIGRATHITHGQTYIIDPSLELNDRTT